MRNSLSQADIQSSPILVDTIKQKTNEERPRRWGQERPIEVTIPTQPFVPEPPSVTSRFTIYQNGKERHYVHKDGSEKIAFRADATHIRPEGKIDRETLGAMVEVAKSRGWSEIQINGNKDFARSAWIEIEARGGHSRGYEPTREDRAAAGARAREIAVERPTQQRMSDGGQRLYDEIVKVIDEKVRDGSQRDMLKRETAAQIIEREGRGRVIDFPEQRERVVASRPERESLERHEMMEGHGR